MNENVANFLVPGLVRPTEYLNAEKARAEAPFADPGTCSAGWSERPVVLRCGYCKFTYYCGKGC